MLESCWSDALIRGEQCAKESKNKILLCRLDSSSFIIKLSNSFRLLLIFSFIFCFFIFIFVVFLILLALVPLVPCCSRCIVVVITTKSTLDCLGSAREGEREANEKRFLLFPVMILMPVKWLSMRTSVPAGRA